MRFSLSIATVFVCLASLMPTLSAQENKKKQPNEKPEHKQPPAVKRIDQIEKQLEKVLKRLEQLGEHGTAPEGAKATASATLEAPKPAKSEKTAKSAEKTDAQPAAKPESAATADAKSEPADQPASTKDTKQAAEAAKPVANSNASVDKQSKDEEKPLSLKVDEKWLEQISWRSLGPANMSGRIVDIEVSKQDPYQWHFATASGGILKTNNQGVTVEHQFDSEETVSIGAIAVDPQDKDVVWVGTGEANPRNSVSYGNGVYKSTDGGKTYEHMGLEETYQIGRVLIHPTDSNTVYVGALGRLYGSNRERGVYKTSDGGDSWQQVLYVNDDTGVIDMIMNPEDPDTIIAALWNRKRDGFDGWPGSVEKPDGIDGYDPIRKWGPGAGLYKTTDGGANWKQLTKGLPPGKLGRVGLDWQSKGPHVIYAIIDCEDIGKGPKPFTGFLGLVGIDDADGPLITQLFPDSPADKAGAKPGDRLVSVEGTEATKYDDLTDALREKKIGQRITLALSRGGEAIEISTKLAPRPGSRTPAPSVYLGVSGGDSEGKIVLRTVTKGGPAEKAGLKPNDVVTSFDGKKPENYQALVAAVREMADGDKIAVEVMRGEENIKLDVTIANRPTQGAAQRQSSAYMGIQGQDGKDGATMTVVTKDGPSDKGGMKAGDVVTKVGDEKITSYDELIAQIRSRQPGDKMQLIVRRKEKEVKLTITLGDRNNSSTSDRPYTYSYYGQTPNAQDMQGADGYKYGGIYKSTDAGETWMRVNSLNTRPMYFSVIRVDPSDENRVYVMGVSQFQSTNGGLTFTSDFGRGVHADAHDLWIDPADGRHMIIGGDGGFYVTYDYGRNWDHINTAAIGQFYHVAIRPTEPYWVVGGLQDNGSWAGPGISKTGGAINEDWISVGGGDGFVCRVDPNDPDLIYYESQNGGMARRNLRTGDRASIRPAREQGLEYRFNWKTPFILSPHNSKIFLTAGNYVFRSLDRGNNLKRISPEITLTKRGSATALAQSPRDENVMYVGTDDGALWATVDGGKQWNNITENLGAPQPMWVATIEASKFVTGRVYVTLDGHRSDDDAAYVYVSEDNGKSFTALHSNLPRGSSRCLREDISNPNMLMLGTEFGFFITLDRGKNWTQFNQDLPSVAIHDLAQHPTNGEVVLATHGRSLWAFDATPLRQIDPKKLTAEPALMRPQELVRWRSDARRGGTSRAYRAQNPSSGATLWYTLPEKVKSTVIQITDISGKSVAELKGSIEPGLHRVSWNLRSSAGRRVTFAATGSYRATLKVDGKDVQSHVLEIVRDPNTPSDAVADEVYEAALDADAERSAAKKAAKRQGLDFRSDF